MVAQLMDEMDLDPRYLKVVFLDLQGAEEIGTLIFCRNFSVAVTMVSAVRSLTYGDLRPMDADGQLGNRIRCTPLFQEARFRPNGLPGRYPFQQNHVFHWTHSMLAVSPSAMRQPEQSCCRGIVEAMASLQLAPGHHGYVEGHVRTSPDHPQSVDVEQLAAAHRYLVGTADMLVPYSAEKDRRHFFPLHLTDVLRLVRDNRANLRVQPGTDCRHVVDMATTLVVPLPRLAGIPTRGDYSCGVVSRRHSAPFSRLLPLLHHALFGGNGGAGGSASGAPSSAQRAPLDLAGLAQVCKRCGIPEDLCRTIQCLYHNYASFLADPFLFDSVLDLYDVFAALHAVLTQQWPAKRAAEVGLTSGAWLPPLDAPRLMWLSEVIQHMHDGMMHRIGKAYPEAQIREVAVDFRGGLNQVLFAANAALLCGLDLFREVVAPSGSKTSIGGLIRISLRPGAYALLPFRRIVRGVQLPVVQADVPHILHAPTYGDYVHECAHFIHGYFNASRQDRAALDGRFMSERVEEVFAALIEHALIFGEDRDSFLFHHVISFAKGRTSLRDDDRANLMQFSELIIRLFLAADAMPAGPASRKWLEQDWPCRPGGRPEVLARFEQALEKVCPFLPEYERLWVDPSGPARRYCVKQFDWIYRSMTRYMPQLWRDAKRVFRCLLDIGLPGWDGSQTGGAAAQLREAAKQALEQGKPVVQSCATMPEAPRRASLDSLMLICALLYCYISQVRRVGAEEQSAVDAAGIALKGRAIHLVHAADGSVDYDQSKRPWYDFQVERGAAAMYSPVPAQRRDRLLKEIVMIKTFWGISSDLRALRLYQMIAETSCLASPGATGC